jgi:hypothetical protein
MTCAFKCFQSHCNILKKNYEFWCMMCAFTIFFGEDSFIFNFVGYGLVTKSPGAGCTFEEVGEGGGGKQNVKRWM